MCNSAWPHLSVHWFNSFLKCHRSVWLCNLRQGNLERCGGLVSVTSNFTQTHTNTWVSQGQTICWPFEHAITWTGCNRQQKSNQFVCNLLTRFSHFPSGLLTTRNILYLKPIRCFSLMVALVSVCLPLKLTKFFKVCSFL